MRKNVFEKKLLVLLFGVLLYSYESANAQVVLTQDFSSATGTTAPAGWTNTTVSGDGIWSFDDPGERAIADGGFSGNFAIFDSDIICGSGETGILEGPSFDASLSGSYILQYDNHFRSYSSAVGLPKVEVWNGSAWTLVSSYTATTSDGYPASNMKTLDITVAAGSSTTAKVRFVFENGSCDWYWAIDNIQIERVACAQPVSLAAGSVTATSAEITWSGTGDFILEYGPSGYTPGTGATAGAGGTLVDPAVSPYTIPGLVSGNTYDVYVRRDCGSSLYSNNATVSFTTIPPPPANDECAGAISLTVNPDYSCSSVTAGNTASATSSSGETAPSCGASGANDDVWFSFVATNTNHRVVLSGVSASEDMAMAAYSGTCGSLVQVLCSDPNTMDLTGLTAGNTYYIRAWTWASTATTTASFDICVGTPPPPPANDEISGAVSLTVNPDYDCGTVTAGTTVSATASSPAPSCTASGANDDIWFSFTATQTSHRVSVINTGGSSDMNMVVYTDNTAATEVPGGGTCENISVKDLSGLTIGQTYFIRIYTWTSTLATTSDFDMCIGTPPPPPANDEASGAVTLTLGAGCTGAAYTNSGGTQSAGEPFGSCSSDQGFNTVWYKFVAPAGGAVKISTDFDGGTLTDTRVALFSATNAADYATFQIISCDDDGGDLESFNSIVYATGLTSGTTYYVQVDVYDTDTDPGSYCITVDELSGTMISATNTCTSSYETPVSLVVTSYTGWVPLIDDSGNLVALVRNAAGIDPDDLSPAQNVHTGTIRTDDNGDSYLDRNYRINYSGTVTDPFEVQLFFLNAELTAYGEDIADLNITRITGTECSADLPTTGDRDLLSQSGNGAAGDVRWIAFTTPSFSNFFVGTSTEPLAITLGNISAVNQGSVNIIHWNTLKEAPGDRFELERSADGRGFTKIADIDAKGTAGNYEYTDEQPVAGVNFYRILMINTDGGRFYSDVVNATVGNTGKRIEAFPNPASEELTVYIKGGIGSNAVITIADITGRVVSSVSGVSSERVELSLEGLAQGIYFVKYADDHFSQTVKVTKK